MVTSFHWSADQWINEVNKRHLWTKNWPTNRRFFSFTDICLLCIVLSSNDAIVSCGNDESNDVMIVWLMGQIVWPIELTIESSVPIDWDRWSDLEVADNERSYLVVHQLSSSANQRINHWPINHDNDETNVNKVHELTLRSDPNSWTLHLFVSFLVLMLS